MSKRSNFAIRSFLRFMSRHKLACLVTGPMFIFSNILIAFVPVYIGKLTGALAQSPPNKHDAIVFTIILIVLSSGHNLTWRFSELLYLKFIKRLSHEYENLLFEKTIRQPYPYFVDKFTGQISTYITTIRQEFREFFDNVFFEYSTQLINLLALGVILTSINWQTGVIFGVGVICMLLVGRYTLANSNNKEKIATEVDSTKQGKMIDIIANFVNVKSFKSEPAEVSLMHNEQTKAFKAARKSFIAEILYWGTTSFFVRDLIWPLALGVNVYLFFQGEVTVAQFATLISALLLFSTTIWETIWSVSQFNLKFARAEEAHTYLFGNRLLQEVNTTKPSIKPVALKQNLDISNLEFAYPDKLDALVLKNINLHIKKAEKIGIVGKSGSGKTTLTKLLLDYYPTKNGSLLVDGGPVSSEQIAQLISYVPQDTSLFHRTIAENIAYATERKVSREEIVKAAKQAHAHEFIKDISDGYDALVGERGVKLSAGQRQRIAIARAFLDDKPILILDEATSALDSESEVLVQKALENLWDNKTVIAIAHRLSTLRQMDRIIVMDQGSIIEEGTHEQLLRKKGKYAQLWNHQSGGFIDEE